MQLIYNFLCNLVDGVFFSVGSCMIAKKLKKGFDIAEELSILKVSQFHIFNFIKMKFDLKEIRMKIL